MKRPAFIERRIAAALRRWRDRRCAQRLSAASTALATPPFRTEEEWHAWCRQDEIDEAREMIWSEIGRP